MMISSKSRDASFRGKARGPKATFSYPRKKILYGTELNSQRMSVKAISFGRMLIKQGKLASPSSRGSGVHLLVLP